MKKSITSFLLSIISFTVLLQAQPVSIDSTFGANGETITAISNEEILIEDMTILPDDKIIVGGRTDDAGGNERLILLKYLADGSPDTDFGTTGAIISSFGGNSKFGGIAVQADGRIVATGTLISGGAASIILARYNADGNFDNSINNSDYATIPVGGTNSRVADVVLQSDNKILVAGTISGSPANAFVARFLSNGEIDSTFGTNGFVQEPLGFGFDLLNRLIAEDNGNITISTMSNLNIWLVFRFLPDGSRDSSFAVDGKSTAPFISDWYNPVELIKLSNGKYLQVGRLSTELGISLARYNSNGTMDSTFGTNGFATTDLDSFINTNAVSIQPDGKIVVAGYKGAFFLNTVEVIMCRLNEDGTLDSTFNAGSPYPVIVTREFNGNSVPVSIGFQQNGKMILCANNESDFSAALARYNNGLNVSISPALAPNYELSCFPNPFSEELKLTLKMENNDNAEIKLLDLQGKEVYNFGVYEMRAGAHHLNLNVPAGLQANLYFLEVIIGGQSNYLKVLKGN